MSLVTVAEARARFQNNLSDADLQTAIDAIEAEIVRKFGPHYVDGTTEFTQMLRGGDASIQMNRRIESVSAVTEQTTIYASASTVDASFYHVWGDAGRIERAAGCWGAVVHVAYLPQDDNALRKEVILGLLKLDLQRTPFQSESIAGEYSYTVGDQKNWSAERARILGRLNLVTV